MKRSIFLLALTLCAGASAGHGTSNSALPPIRVILVGDSTIAQGNGYGDALCARFRPEVSCVNLAANGRSSSSFRTEGRWDKVRDMLREGGGFRATYVLVQFGHNDQPGKKHATDLVTGFPANMARYAAETRALGGVPVLVTPLTRRTFQGPNLRDTLGPWAAATRKAAAQEHAALLDLNADSAAAVQQMGQAEADTLAMAAPPSPGRGKAEGAAKSQFDWTHLGPKGAELFSAVVARELTQAVPAISPYLDSGRKAEFNVRDYGGKGDGVTKNTAAIQQAIDAAARQGGTVVFPAGTYLSGAIFVKSGVTLKLDKGVTLLGSRNIEDYPVMPTRIAGIEMRWPAALVNVYRQAKASIIGEGTIDGDGKVFWDHYWALRKEYEPRGLRWASDYDAQRPRLVQVFDSSRVKVGGGLLLRRSGFWTVHVCYSEDVSVDGVTIDNNEEGHGPSTDGIDIDSSRRVAVANADISVNDDALVLKAGRDADGLRVNRPTEDVVIHDVKVRFSKGGIVFGSETSGGFRNIEAYRLSFDEKTPVGILFKSAHTRGGWGEDIRLHDITMNGTPVVMRINMNWNPAYSYARIPADVKDVPDHWKVMATQVPKEKGIARFRDVKIWNIKATGAKSAFEVAGFAEAPLQRFQFDRLDIEAKGGGYIRDAQDWRFANTKLQLPADAPIEVGQDSRVDGLPPGSFVERAAEKK
jgi:lysophospholipase L1-like esterase